MWLSNARHTSRQQTPQSNKRLLVFIHTVSPGPSTVPGTGRAPSKCWLNEWNWRNNYILSLSVLALPSSPFRHHLRLPGWRRENMVMELTLLKLFPCPVLLQVWDPEADRLSSCPSPALCLCRVVPLAFSNHSYWYCLWAVLVGMFSNLHASVIAHSQDLGNVSHTWTSFQTTKFR